jgi:cyclopropane fatty-acyl-phospholipid synthase-like methyltransferase
MSRGWVSARDPLARLDVPYAVMGTAPGPIRGWTRENARHLAGFFRQGRNPAARVYESIGTDFFLAPAPGWLNLGLWEGPGSAAEAEAACRRLVRTVASALPADGVILDVGNGLGTQDPVIAEVTRPRTLVAVNITEWQLRAGRDRLRSAGAAPVAADATRLPIAGTSVDGVISVEAAFHFASRVAFFRECARVLRPGGVLTTSDISTERMPRGPLELAAGVVQLRVFGLRRGAAMTADEIAEAARTAGLMDVTIERCGDRVFDQVIELTRERLRTADGIALGQRQAGRLLLAQIELLWRRRIIDYVLLRARKP